jgi:hypothetical protein
LLDLGGQIALLVLPFVPLQRAAATQRLEAPAALSPTASMCVPVYSPPATQAIFDLWETVIVWRMSCTRTMCSSFGMRYSSLSHRRLG